MTLPATFSSLKLDSSFRSLKSENTFGVNDQTRSLMTRRVQTSLVAVFALMLNGVCLCAAAIPSCTAASCAAHERQGTCLAHQRHQDPRGSHECCQTPACSSPTEIGAGTDSHAGNRLQAPLFNIVRVPIFDLGDPALRLLATREAHSPPSAVPVFLAIRSLLL
jgi:hypothetical protein